MRIILLGPQGSGKTVISRKITEKYGLPVVKFQNVADELNSVAKQDSELGKLAKESIAAGSVSDDVCTAVLKRVLGKADLSAGFVLVDYPKYSGQANEIDEAMNRLKRPVDLVLMIDIDRDELMERRVGRIDCDHCGAHYNLYINPPMVEGVCDECGSRVSRRPRGYEENIANQLRDYDMLLGPILEHYRLNGKLRHVDANGTEDQLWKAVRKVVDATPPTFIETEPVEEAAVSVDDKPEDGSKKNKLGGKALKKKSKKRAAGTTKSKATKETAQKKKTAVKKKKVKKGKDSGSAQPPATRKTTKKKASVKTTSKKKVAKKKIAKKKSTQKKAASKKKPAAKRKVASKKSAIRKTVVAAKKSVSKKKVAKKKVVKKAPVQKKTPRKKSVIKKKTSKKKVVKKKTTGKKAAKKR